MAARRKNSAEMLDILRRMSRDERARGSHQAQKSNPPADPLKETGGRPPAPKVTVAAMRIEARRSGDAPLFEPGRLKEKEGEAAPARPITSQIRRAFLSVLSGGKGSGPASRKDAHLLPPFGVPEGHSGKTTDGEETEERLATAGGEEPLSLSPPPRARALLAGAALPSVLSAAAQLPGGAPVSAHAELAPHPPARTPFSPPEGGVKEWPGTALPAADLDVFSVRGTSLPAPPADRKEPEVPAPEVPAPPPAAEPPESRGEDTPLPEATAARAPRKPLFGPDGSTQKLFAVLASRLWGEEISGGLKKRVEIRVVTIGLYVVVALGAMLLMAFILNPRDSGDRDKLLPMESQESEEGDASALQKLETIGSGPRIPPAVRNAEEKPEGPSAAASGGTEAAGKIRVITGNKGKGWFMQVRAFLTDREAKQVIEHLESIGYRSVWQRPDHRDANFYSLLVGPFATEKEADAEVPRYKDLMTKNPLRKPRLKFTEPYVPREIR